MASMTGMRPRLLAVDLDGTLLSDRRTIPAAHREFYRWCQQECIPMVVVTGRPLVTAVWPWRELAMVDPLVCFNGAWIGCPGEPAIAHEPLAEDEVRQIIQVLRRYDGMISTYPREDGWLVDRLIPLAVDWPERYDVAIAVDAAPFDDWRGPSSKVMFVAEPVQISRVLPELQRELGARFHIVASEPDRIELHRLGRTKAWGLAHLAAHWDIPRDAVWAAGDADNDIEMIEWAGRGFAMAGATPALAEAADDELPSAQAGGLSAWRALIEAI